MDLVLLLLKHGADVNARLVNMTPRRFVLPPFDGYTNSARLLLEHVSATAAPTINDSTLCCM